MSRRTTVRVLNSTSKELNLVEAVTSAGTWGAHRPAPLVASGAVATFDNVARGRFGSSRGRAVYAVSGGRVTLNWDNPFVGRNTFRMEAEGASFGVVCDGDDDESNAVVTFTVQPSRRVSVPGFAASSRGFHFTNSWSGEPLKRVNLKLGSIPIGKASNGLCGGMVFAALDWFEARRPIPSMTTSPPDGSALRTYVIDRLIDSFDLPGGVVPYATTMASGYPAHDGELLAAVAQVPSRAGLLARRTWPTVKARIDAGHPCPLGLVMVESDNPADLKHQHQVLAYAYQLRGTQLTMWVYDPNSPGDDHVTIAYDTARTDLPVVVHHRVDADGPLVCAFVPRYTVKTPPSEA